MKPSTNNDTILRLNAPEELFEVRATDVLSPNGRFVSGIDELVAELTPLTLRPGMRAVIALPADQLQPDTEDRLRQALYRYCRSRLRHIKLARSAQWQDVMAAFRVGGIVFALGILTSYYFSASGLAALTKLLLGDGFFLVIAWVGLWYPLDALVHYRRQSAREGQVLAFIASMETIVRAGVPSDAEAVVWDSEKAG
ncbi:MAG TPA: hypothetical protein VHX17_00690 [Candidatus Cybelea sp.]|nr:hypothetical protein [Candidatus Cybelea sp.]